MNPGAPVHTGGAYRPGVAEFERGDIDPQLFDHAAHVYVAWSYLRGLPLAEAISRFTAALRRLTARFGAEQKYHETITWFFMILVAERRSGASGEDWSVFAAENPDLLGDAGRQLRRFYSPARLSSSVARQRFLLPDRSPHGPDPV